MPFLTSFLIPRQGPRHPPPTDSFWRTSAAWPSSTEKNTCLLPSSSPVALAFGPFHADFAPTRHLLPARLWSAPDGSSIHRWIEDPQQLQDATADVDAHGNNFTAITDSTGDHSRSLHDYMPQFVATELGRIGANSSLRRRATSQPPASSRTFPSRCSGLRQPTRRSSSSMAFFRISPLMPVAQDSASSCSLRIRRV